LDRDDPSRQCGEPVVGQRLFSFVGATEFENFSVQFESEIRRLERTKCRFQLAGDLAFLL
jgi:hypothetical protein